MINLIYINIITIFISMLIIMINFIISKKKINEREKSSAFECGFDPFSSPRIPFSIQFYLISIIFLIFDIEILIFLPMINSFLYNKLYLWLESTMIFILILLMGLYIEWNDGALNWLK